MIMEDLKILCFICTVFMTLHTSHSVPKDCPKYDTKKKCEENGVQFYLRTKKDGDTQELNADNPDTIKEADFLETLSVKFIIHDHNGDKDHFLVTPLQEEYFKQLNNVVVMNYTKLSQDEEENRCYRTGVENSRSISECAAKVIEAIIEHNNKGITIEHFHFLGIGLGGQMVGQIPHFIHENYRDKIVRITGIDPANDGFFEAYGTDEYILSEGDAQLVDVIHSNAGIIGKLPPMGHIDWYPNNGTFQPECLTGYYMCDHISSAIYYMESINNINPKVEATWCPDLEAKIFRSKSCKDVIVPFGENVKEVFINQKMEKGVYFFQTRPVVPYIAFIKPPAPYNARIRKVPNVEYPIYAKHLEKVDQSIIVQAN